MDSSQKASAFCYLKFKLNIRWKIWNVNKSEMRKFWKILESVIIEKSRVKWNIEEILSAKKVNQDLGELLTRLLGNGIFLFKKLVASMKVRLFENINMQNDKIFIIIRNINVFYFLIISQIKSQIFFPTLLFKFTWMKIDISYKNNDIGLFQSLTHVLFFAYPIRNSLIVRRKKNWQFNLELDQK